MGDNRYPLQKIAGDLLAFLLCSSIIINSNEAKPTGTDYYSLCESQECLHHANTIMKNMKPETDPCEDFYSFACGGYIAKFGENDTKSVYDDTWLDLQLQIKGLLENLQPDKGSTSEKLKIVYENCMNNDSSEMKATPDALQFLNDIGISNWPNQVHNFQFVDLSETLGKLAVYGEFAFISFKPSPYENKYQDSHLPSPVLVMPGNFLSNSKMQPDLENSILRILDYFNIPKDEAISKWQNFKTIEEIGIQLQNEESGHSLGCRSSSRNMYMEVNCSEENLGKLKYLCNIWKSAMEYGDLSPRFSSNIIHISCRWNHFYYIENIFSSLVNVSQGSLADYLSLRFFISHLDDLNSYFRLTKKTYPGDKQSKTPAPISRWEYCVGWIIKSMNLALGYEYNNKILTEAVEKNVFDIIRDYVQELFSSTENLNWLNKKVKLYLQKQLRKLDIGFKITMDNFRNESGVENYYKEFHPIRGSFLKNILEYDKIATFRKDKTLFNSFYSSSDPYTMDFGLALLLPPTFYYGLPKLWNYAALGSIIGHELSHNLMYFFHFVYLDDETEEYLNNKVQCYLQQYSQFIMQKTGKKITSKETEEEIVADNLGWALTEKIIKNIMNDNNLFKLPGLDYTPQQIAYISFAQDSCAVLSKETEAEFFASKPQNLQKLRVLGILQNSKTFSQTFNCPRNSVMNPATKCVFFD